MGFNAGIVHIAGAKVSDLTAVGLSETGEYVSGDYALMGEQPAALETHDGILLVDGTGEITGEDSSFAAALGRRVTAATLGSTATVYRIAVTGPQGVVREVVDVEGERQVDTGDPLPEESGDVTLFEDETFEIFEQLTGVTVRDVIDGNLQVLGRGTPQTDPSVPQSSEQKKKKGFFGRLFGG